MRSGYPLLVNAPWKSSLPYVFMALAALSRWPGLFPQNFSAIYAVAFCAGAFFCGPKKWVLPFGTLLISDLALNSYYYFVKHVDAFQPFQLFNYAAFAVIIVFGKKFSNRSRLDSLVAGGIVAALIFYLITNFAAWLFNPFHNPEYTRNLAGLIIALTKGTAGHPPTIEFFRNTLMSGGLFTALFAGVLKLTASQESAEEKEAAEANEPEPDTEAVPEEAKV